MSATIKLKYLARAVLIVGCAIIATIVIALVQIHHAKGQSIKTVENVR